MKTTSTYEVDVVLLLGNREASRAFAMQYRKDPLVTNEYYHIFTKSIAGYRIFNSDKEYSRMLALLLFYQMEDIPVKFSRFIENQASNQIYQKIRDFMATRKRIIKILAYCLMPTHVHLIVQQEVDEGISRFMSNVLNGYTRYFNLRHNRKGPLWSGRFKSVRIDTDRYFKHLTRYIHLNPTTGNLVKRPEEWNYSSYREYLGLIEEDLQICGNWNVLNLSITEYKKFVENHQDYQKTLASVRHLLFE